MIVSGWDGKMHLTPSGGIEQLTRLRSLTNNRIKPIAEHLIESEGVLGELRRLLEDSLG